MTQRVVIEGYVDYTFDEDFDIGKVHDYLKEFAEEGNFTIMVYNDKHDLIHNIAVDAGEISENV